MAKKGKKLSRAEREHKKAMRKQRIMSLVLVFIMVGGLVGIGAYNMSGNNEQKTQVGPYDITTGQHNHFYNPEQEVQAIFMHVDDSTRIPFYSYPQTLNRFETQGNMTKVLENAESVVLSGTGERDMESQVMDLLRYKISNNAPVQVVNAVPETQDGNQLPVVTCDNATARQPVVMLDFGNETMFNTTDSCIEISFKPETTHFVRDKLLYSLYGVSE